MQAATPVTRFAPSPTGLLHLGHAHSALAGWRAARPEAPPAGRFLLRLEDIDPTRCRPEYAAAIEEDLRWLGLDWDGPVRVQSRHFPEYRAVLARLEARGLLYPCFCTRAEIAREVAAAAHAPHGPDGPLYPGTCRRLSPAARRPAFTRFNVFLRDSFECQYCGQHHATPELTFDHVIPRCRGGRTTWENVVTACGPCNLRKGSKLPRECQMLPRQAPRQPTSWELQENGRSFPPNYLHESWRDYLYWDTELES